MTTTRSFGRHRHLQGLSGSMWTVIALLNLYVVSSWAAATGLALAGGAIIVLGCGRMLRQARSRAVPQRSPGGSFTLPSRG
jgi:hypothetical protein